MTPIEILPIPLIMGLVEALKNVGLPNKILPIADVLFGIGFSVAIQGKFDVQSVLGGIVLGLTSAGLYRSQKVVRGVA